MVYRVETTISGTTGAPYMSVHHFDSSIVLEDAQDCVNAVGDFWSALNLVLANDMSFTVSGDVVELDNETGTATAFHSVTPVTGLFSEGGEKIPFICQALVRWGTGGVVNGRQVRGRTFIPCVTVGGVDEGNLLASTQTSIQAAATALRNDADSTLVVWSRPLWNDEHTAIVREGSAHIVTSNGVASSFASLTRRRD